MTKNCHIRDSTIDKEAKNERLNRSFQSTLILRLSPDHPHTMYFISSTFITQTKVKIKRIEESL